MFKKIKNYERYSVDEFGNVRNDDTGRILKHAIMRGGYRMVSVINEDGRKWKLVSRLVAENFVKNTDNKQFVHHINENKDDNCFDNLMWVTRSENNNAGTRNLRTSISLGKRILIFKKDGSFVGVFHSAREAAKKLNTHANHLSEIANGRRKSINGYIAKWEE